MKPHPILLIVRVHLRYLHGWNSESMNSGVARHPFVNVFAALYAIQRKFFLKDTGRKLTHVNNQALAGSFPLPSPTETEEQE